jgi:hypothetical protein
MGLGNEKFDPSDLDGTGHWKPSWREFLFSTTQAIGSRLLRAKDYPGSFTILALAPFAMHFLMSFTSLNTYFLFLFFVLLY